jgi:DNA-binding NtrC family response regulator
VKAGAFREDLLYRLNTVEVLLPPLRDRREDVPGAGQRLPRRPGRPLPQAGAALRGVRAQGAPRVPWPGNVRELEHCVERAVLMARGTELTPEDLVLRPRDGGARVEDMTLEDAERYLIQRALGRTDGSVSDAAKILGLSRSALYRRLQQYGLKAS